MRKKLGLALTLQKAENLPYQPDGPQRSRGIAQMMRAGLYRPVHVKTLRSVAHGHRQAEFGRLDQRSALRHWSSLPGLVVGTDFGCLRATRPGNAQILFFENPRRLFSKMFKAMDFHRTRSRKFKSCHSDQYLAKFQQSSGTDYGTDTLRHRLFAFQLTVDVPRCFGSTLPAIGQRLLANCEPATT